MRKTIDIIECDVKYSNTCQKLINSPNRYFCITWDNKNNDVFYDCIKEFFIKQNRLTKYIVENKTVQTFD